MYDNYVFLTSGKHRGIWFSGVNSIGKVCALLYVVLYFLPIISVWDVHAGYGFGTNYDIPVVILRKQDSKPEWFRIGRLFWNSVATEPICNAGIVVEKCSVSVWRWNTFSVKLGKVYGCRMRLVWGWFH